MFCKHCGGSINDGSAFCPSCGKESSSTEVQIYKNFTISEALSFGWKVLKNNFVASFLVTVLVTVSLFFSLFTSGLSSILSIVFSIYSSYILTKIALTVPEGKFKVDRKLLSTQKSSLFNFTIAYLIYTIIISSGIILFIIPGLYFGMRFCCFDYLIIDENCSSFEAFKRSWNLTKNYQLKLIQWALVAFGIIFIGILPLGLGAVIVYPLVTYSGYFIYRKLKYGK
jgi:uncharacterized membrane protein